MFPKSQVTETKQRHEKEPMYSYIGHEGNVRPVKVSDKFQTTDLRERGRRRRRDTTRTLFVAPERPKDPMGTLSRRVEDETS